MRLLSRAAAFALACLSLPTPTRAFFLYHRASRTYVGVDRTNNFVAPVSIDYAIDFSIQQSTLTQNSPLVCLIRYDNGKQQAIDIRYGMSGTDLIFYNVQNSANQSFLITLGPDNSYIINTSDYKYCFGLDKLQSKFVKTPCNDKSIITFDIYIEMSPEDTRSGRHRHHHHHGPERLIDQKIAAGRDNSGAPVLVKKSLYGYYPSKL